jgi:hypothetical protein
MYDYERDELEEVSYRRPRFLRTSFGNIYPAAGVSP